jgi:hypothetical protein
LDKSAVSLFFKGRRMKRNFLIVLIVLLIVGCSSFSLSNPFLGDWSFGTGKTKVDFLFGTSGMVKISGPKFAGVADYSWDGDSLTLKYRTDSRILYYHFTFSKDHIKLNLEDVTKNIIVLTKGK